MPFTTTVRRGLAAATGTAAVLALTAVPAQANDHTMTMSHDGVVLARATWDDSVDTLCITVLTAGADDYAAVAITPVDGQPEPPRDPREASTTKRQGRYCTPNLSIREDVKYRMQMQWRDRLQSPTKLYNSRITTFYS